MGAHRPRALSPRAIARPATVSWTPAGKPVPSQRLASGELVFLARKVPPFRPSASGLTGRAGAKRGTVKAEGVHTDRTRSSRCDRRDAPGAIASLFSRSLKQELVDAKAAPPP